MKWWLGTGSSMYFILANSKRDPMDAAEKETFVLGRHTGFDSQTILVDDEGDGTGIIDWDNCIAVPCRVGYTSLAKFLRRDWSSW
ncbi:hypothetical protein PTTW11_11200 [Pyrenophora teres f. teres]|uniref:Aminoglycoside phosphotransferase domain-containing protein n=1 Tax=Pyrenophora teres f. teres TaxID=97479 RepID=A0A6S6WFL4_9PLEO|nr:hypothetical protein PTTW11_11200 [Pyrenophora teres f. teres]